MNRTFRNALVMFLVVTMISLLSACAGPGSEDISPSSGDDAKSQAKELEEELEGDSDIENPVYNNEQDGAEIRETKADVAKFYGNWEASSDKAKYLYGNLNLKINKDGTWSGNITEEDFSGKWATNGTGITLSSEIINCDLFYTEDGSLMFRDHDFPEDPLVLTKAGF